MKNLQAFLHPAQPEHLFGVVSDRFTGEDGKPIPWEFQAVSLAENERLIAACTRTKGGETDFDREGYKAKIIAASVVYPDLKNAELQAGLGTQGDEAGTLSALLKTVGEYNCAYLLTNQVNGFAVDGKKELEDAKNV